MDKYITIFMLDDRVRYKIIKIPKTPKPPKASGPKGKPKNTKIKYRDSLGRFTSQQVYMQIHGLKTKPQAEKHLRKTESERLKNKIEKEMKKQREREDRERKRREEDERIAMEAEEKYRLANESKWLDWRTLNKPVEIKIEGQAHLDASGNVVMMAPFKFNRKIFQKFGISEEEQENLYNLFVAANIALGEIRDYTRGEIGKFFTVNLYDSMPLDLIERRKKAAEDILSGEFIERTTQKYKDDFIDALESVLPTSVENFKQKMVDLINTTDAQTFYHSLSMSNMESYAYIMYQELELYGIKHVLSQLNAIVRNINYLRGGETEYFGDEEDYI